MNLHTFDDAVTGTACCDWCDKRYQACASYNGLPISGTGHIYVDLCPECVSKVFNLINKRDAEENLDKVLGYRNVASEPWREGGPVEDETL